MGDFLKEIIKNQLGSVRADWADGHEPTIHSSNVLWPPAPLEDDEENPTILEVKSCDGCLLNYDNYLCRHPNADGSFKTYDAPDGEVHEKCPLKTLGLTLNVKAEKP